MTTSVIRVAIAGQGRSGWSIHAACLRELPERYRIVAVADQLEERREEARREFGARVYDDWTGLLADGDFDLFVNALPTPLHVPATLAALKAGKHVLCEKPMAGSLADFDRMTAAAAAHGRLLAPFQNNRHQPFFEKIQEVVASGVLGKLVYIRSSWSGFARRWDWQTLRKNMGGSLLNTGPHALDQALVLFGERTPSVFCRMDCRNPFGADAEDHCTVTLFDPERQAPQVDIVISAYMAYPQGERYNIGGTCGGLTGNEHQLKWRYFDPAQAPEQAMWNWSVNRQYPHEQLPWVEESWSLDTTAHASRTSGYTLKSLPTGPHRIYGNLHDALVKGDPLLIPLSQVRRQIAVIEECHRQNPLPQRHF